jgi:hypothetical protein
VSWQGPVVGGHAPGFGSPAQLHSLTDVLISHAVLQRAPCAQQCSHEQHEHGKCGLAGFLAHSFYSGFPERLQCPVVTWLGHANWHRSGHNTGHLVGPFFSHHGGAVRCTCSCHTHPSLTCALHFLIRALEEKITASIIFSWRGGSAMWLPSGMHRAGPPHGWAQLRNCRAPFFLAVFSHHGSPRCAAAGCGGLRRASQGSGQKEGQWPLVPAPHGDVQ